MAIQMLHTQNKQTKKAVYISNLAYENQHLDVKELQKADFPNTLFLDSESDTTIGELALLVAFYIFLISEVELLKFYSLILTISANYWY